MHRIAFLLSGLLALTACTATPTVVEAAAAAVTVRYGVGAEEEAMQLAQKVCAAHQKKAQLRNSANFGLTDRYGHFDCI